MCFRSEVVKDCLDPVWRLMIDLPVDDPSTLEDLRAEVWDKDTATQDDFLGECVVSASVARTAMASGQAQDVWRKLEGVERGSIKMEVAWSKMQVERPPQQVRIAVKHVNVAVAVVVSICTKKWVFLLFCTATRTRDDKIIYDD